MITLPDHKSAKASDFASSPVFFLTGKAGSGKTTLIKSMIASDPLYGMLAATTGKAAVNLGEGVTTMHSLLKFHDISRIKPPYNKMLGVLKGIRSKGFRWLIIDEVSMMKLQELDAILGCIDEANKVYKNRPPLGLMLVGDFAQLPPIAKTGEEVPWIFDSIHWPRFTASSLKLTESYRQSSGEFLEALNDIRLGNKAAAYKLRDAGCIFSSTIDIDYEGCTLFGTNNPANEFNQRKLSKIEGASNQYEPSWWSGIRDYDGNAIIPMGNEDIINPLVVKESSLVMILSNDTRTWRYANGDMGYVVACKESSVLVRLLRNDDIVEIFPVKRSNLMDQSNYTYTPIFKGGPDIEDPLWGDIREDENQLDMLVVGEIRYLPLRLAWACTVHKTQGLTLDRIQIDIRNSMFSRTPGMVYVALSRGRDANTIRIVGEPKHVYNNIKADPKVMAANLL